MLLLRSSGMHVRLKFPRHRRLLRSSCFLMASHVSLIRVEYCSMSICMNRRLGREERIGTSERGLLWLMAQEIYLVFTGDSLIAHLSCDPSRNNVSMGPTWKVDSTVTHLQESRHEV